MDNNLLKLYETKNTVFTLGEIAQVLGKSDYVDLKSQVHYYVKKGVLLALRRGLYAKREYSLEEAACKVYAPAYVSLETVLQQAGVIFQYYDAISLVSYKSRIITIAGKKIRYRRIDPTIATLPMGIINKQGLAIATPERAFLDLVYLDGVQHFDHSNILDRKIILKMI